jgi:hypothetical protein
VINFGTFQYSANCPEGKDDRASVRQILKLRRVLYCPKCDKELRNVQYYFKHFEWCGREVKFTHIMRMTVDSKFSYVMLILRDHCCPLR